MIIQDEYTWKWEVLKDDPAWLLVSKLKGIEDIVLPRSSILTGRVPDIGSIIHTLESLTTIYNSINDTDLFGLKKDVVNAFLLYYRLYDCCVLLENVVE